MINKCYLSNVYSETNDVNTGLLVEVWRRGFLLDYAIGYHMVSLPTVRYSNEVIDHYINMNLVGQQLENNCRSNSCVHVIIVQLYVLAQCSETQRDRSKFTILYYIQWIMVDVNMLAPNSFAHIKRLPM